MALEGPALDKLNLRRRFDFRLKQILVNVQVVWKILIPSKVVQSDPK